MNFHLFQMLPVKYNTWRVLSLLICFVILLPTFAVGENLEKRYQESRNAYRSLLQKDERVSSLVEWEEVAAKLRVIVKEGAETDLAANAGYLIANLSEHEYRYTRLPFLLSRSVQYYRQVAYHSSNQKLANDSLLRLGDLYKAELHDDEAARTSYATLLERQPTETIVTQVKRKLEEFITPSELHRKAPIEKLPKLKKGRSVSVTRSVHRENRPLIVLDPGHGGEELGAEGPDGLLEKHVVLTLSFLLEEILENKLRTRVLLTRKTDVNIPLSGRIQLANDRQAALFLSIHANASVRKNARGIETYYLDNTNDEASLKLAERENMAFKEQSSDLSFILSDLIQNAKASDSISLAHYLQDALVETLSSQYPDIINLGVKKAPFYVLVGAHMPCSLVEVSFIDNAIEGRRLGDPRYQALIAQSLYQGIRDYFQSTQPSLNSVL